MSQPTNLEDIVNAVQDLTRVTIAIHGQFDSRNDAVRRLYELSIPPSRIAAILAMKTSDVSSTIAKMKKKAGKSADSESEVTNGQE